MRIMSGWVVDWTDVLAGIGLLIGLIAVGHFVGVLRQIAKIDIGGECRDDCYCANSGQQDQTETCGNCGRYCETGHGE